METSELKTAADLARLAMRVGLIEEFQAQEALAELDNRLAPAEELAAILVRKAHLTDFQRAKLLKGDADGYFLGGYRLLYRIAAGSFGRVFRGDDPRTGQLVAIKVLRHRWSEDPHKIAQFEREGRLGMTLQHPNIVQILAVSRDTPTGYYYLVMEFVEGSNLRDFLAIRKRLSPTEGLRIVEEASSALTYAYSRGMTHRDIKLTNILISTQGTAKLVDFGLAELKAGLEEEGTIDRTVDYAGLERATGAKHGDIRSDIYFLGCVLFEILTGEPLLETTRDKRQRMQKQRFESDKKLEKGLSELPVTLRPLLMRMVALNPAERFQTPSQLVDAIRTARAAVEGGPAIPHGPSGAPTVYVVEQELKFQNRFRDRLKKVGFRVLVSLDASRALQRYQQQPYHGLVVDAATTGDECVEAFERIMRESRMLGLKCVGTLILSEPQAHLANRVTQTENVTVLVNHPGNPVSSKQIFERLDALAPGAKDDGEGESAEPEGEGA